MATISMYNLVFILLIAPFGDANIEACLKGPEQYHRMNPMEYVTHDFKISTSENGSIRLTLEFTWKVKPDVPHHGFFYHLSVDDSEEDYDYYDYNDDYSVNETICVDQLSNVNHLNISDSAIRGICDHCQFMCGYEQFCWKRYRFQAVAQENLTIEAKFGAKYDFQIGTYINFTHSSTTYLHGISTFCKYQLEVKHIFTQKQANKLCKKQSLENVHYAAGPASNFTVSSLRINPTNNKVSLMATWMRPLDVAVNNSITRYRIVIKNTNLYKSKYVQNTNDVDTFSTTFDNLPQNESFMLYARSILEKREGYLYELPFRIPDFDACNISGMIPYCVGNASCKDLDWDKDKGAKCKCYAGFDGDGIHPYYNGSGCYESCNQKHMKNHSCVENAICHMDQNNNTMQCRCIHPYEGDGLRRGTGCISKSIALEVILLVTFSLIATVAVIITTVFIIPCIRRRRRRRRERAEWEMSRFESVLESEVDQ